MYEHGQEETPSAFSLTSSFRVACPSLGVLAADRSSASSGCLPPTEGTVAVTGRDGVTKSPNTLSSSNVRITNSNHTSP